MRVGSCEPSLTQRERGRWAPCLQGLWGLVLSWNSVHVRSVTGFYSDVKCNNLAKTVASGRQCVRIIALTRERPGQSAIASLSVMHTHRVARPVTSKLDTSSFFRKTQTRFMGNKEFWLRTDQGDARAHGAPARGAARCRGPRGASQRWTL